MSSRSHVEGLVRAHTRVDPVGGLSSSTKEKSSLLAATWGLLDAVRVFTAARFWVTAPPQRGPERPCIGKCHREADEAIWSQGCSRGCQLQRLVLSPRCASWRQRGQLLNRATLCRGDLEAEDEIVAADLQDGCANAGRSDAASALEARVDDI